MRTVLNLILGLSIDLNIFVERLSRQWCVLGKPKSVEEKTRASCRGVLLVLSKSAWVRQEPR